MSATAAIRVLRAAGVPFEEHRYRYEDRGGTRVSARELGVDEHHVVKTLVLQDDQRRLLLMLMHGDMDDNVHPAMTVQVVDELIKANRSFDMVWAPNRNHGLNEPYFIRRRWDYFVEHLLGATPPDNYEIQQPRDPWGGGGGQGSAWDDWDDGFPYWKPYAVKW